MTCNLIIWAKDKWCLYQNLNKQKARKIAKTTTKLCLFFSKCLGVEMNYWRISCSQKKQNKKWPNRKKSRHSSPMKTFSLRDKVVLKGGQLLKYFQIKCNSRVRKKKKATKKITGFWIETSNCSSPLMKEFPRLFDIHMRRRKKKTLAFSLPILSYTHIWIFSVVFFCKRQTQKFTILHGWSVGKK